MCGIVGIYNFKRSAEDQKEFIQRSLCTMKHRGPDAENVWQHNNYITGFARLAIRDLSANGNQPMLSSDNSYVISFNGEIYNTKEFKQRLIKQGIQFNSTSDTEVLLYSLIRWGIEYVLQNFDGIFAFAFYDVRRNQLVLARDRAGIKPLYIGKSADGIVYSSQYDHIINHPYIKRNSINEGSLGSYLSLGYVPENSGIVNNTWMLPHGYYSIVTHTGISTLRYFDYPISAAQSKSLSLAEILQEKVHEQLVSDVPIGTFMSGGVDSPLVSYFANQKARIKSFNIGMQEKQYDESEAAAKYASAFNTEHYCKYITEADLFNTIADNTKAFTEPFADYSSIPTLILSQYAREQVTVAMSGDGGDELFWGYPRNVKMLKQGLAFQNSKLVRGGKLLLQKAMKKESVLTRRHLQVDDFPSFYYKSLFITGAEKWIPQVFLGKVSDAFFFEETLKSNLVYKTDARSIMNVLRKLEFDVHLQRILMKVDRASMYHSLEVRVPILSNEMINYSTQLSYTDCIKGKEGKANLKELLASVSNSDLVYQQKKGFIIPLGNWIKQQLKKDIEEKLIEMPAELKPFFNTNKIQLLLGEHMSGKHDWSWFIWSLYSLVNWHSQHRNSFK